MWTRKKAGLQGRTSLPRIQDKPETKLLSRLDVTASCWSRCWCAGLAGHEAENEGGKCESDVFHMDDGVVMRWMMELMETPSVAPAIADSVPGAN